MPSSLRLTALVSAALLAVTLGTTPAPPASAATEGTAPVSSVSSAASPGSTSAARAALARVETVLGAGDGARFDAGGRGTVPRRDATMALRDLANLREELRGADRAAADAYLRRPPSAGGDGVGLDYDGRPSRRSCTDDVCVHYVTGGPHAPALTDRDENGVPDYVDLALRTVDEVADTYAEAGYRRPKPDAGHGGDARTDIYLGDIGDRGLYGYCTSDEPTTAANRDTSDRWAYCVLDEDYSEFRSNTPRENLQVTVAHEYFHAVQFGYDHFEDGWLLEATAAWIEDEMFDDVDDNVQYLRRSQLTSPGTALDTFDATGFHYGTWSFFRLLTERFPEKEGELPRLVLDVWNRADGARGARDLYSWQAVDRTLAALGTTGRAQLARYAVANRRPAAAYEEGRRNRYPTAPVGGARELGPGAAASWTPRLNHLTTWTARLTPRATGGSARLRLAVDLPPTSRGSYAVVTRYPRSGPAEARRVALDRRGDGATAVFFGAGSTAAVEVTLVNGSARFQCWRGTGYSCQGVPRDDRSPARLRVRAVR